MVLGWGRGSFSISGVFLVLWAPGIRFPWGGSYSMSEGSTSLDPGFMGRLWFLWASMGGIPSMEEGII